MLAIPGGPRPSRRDFLRLGSLAALGATVPGVARAEGRAVDPRSDVSCILVWLQGGLSHIDSFDPKPDAPSEVRGEFASIATRVPGILLSEHLPKLAAIQGKFSIVRSLDPRNGSHGVAEAYALSGHPFSAATTFPSYGAVVARERGGREGVPPYIQVGREIDGRFGGGGAGFLGERYNPVVLTGDSSGRASCDRYGRTELGGELLRARRLIEAGARFVTVVHGGWDTHRDNFRRMRGRLLPGLDAALSALLIDLSERGRLDSTLVAVMSDFGRTPRVNALAGRDHWAAAGTALLAGAGLRGGVAVGRTDPRGEGPIEAPYATEDLAATVYDRLGLSAIAAHVAADGRTLPIAPAGRLIRELL